EQLFEFIPPETLAGHLSLMEPDDAVDLVDLLPEDKAKTVLDALSPDLRGDLIRLMSYGPDTAGGIMDPDVVQIRARQTVAEAIDEIRQYVNRVKLDNFFSVFVVDDRRRLVGAVSNSKLLLAGPGENIMDLMTPDPISVSANTDQEEVSQLVRHHDLVSLPVVDTHNRLIGRITVDDVVDVIHEEHEEDMAALAGNLGEFVREDSLWHSLRVRSPWLLVAFAGQLVSAMVMRTNDQFLLLVPQLAFFVPVIMAMGGNMGVQSSSLVIRGLATGEMRPRDIWNRMLREARLAMVMGVLFALALVGGGFLITGNFHLSIATGVALISSILLASVFGIAIPMLARVMGQDPAIATGPFLTTLNDILGVIVYLTVAHLLLF
ncbi:MAG: magnesium transporter, partial [Deltaproteobacteria bacterium]|nr:magnesium transporter [Deltaproteobacteria bacterium]